MTATITVHGGLTDRPQVRVTQGGATVVSFTVASTERYQRDGEWVDGKRLYLRCTAWRQLGDNIAVSVPSLEKGTLVTVTGKLHTREFEHEGQRRSSVELEVTDFAVSLRRATVQVSRVEAATGPNRGGEAPRSDANSVQQSTDGWAVSSPHSAAQYEQPGSGSSYTETGEVPW